MTFKKKKGGSYVVTWDSNASSSDDEKPSLFDTPSCFMAKATKVQTCDDGSDNEHDSDSDNDDDEPTKYELFDILEDAKETLTLREGNAKACIRN